MVAAVLAVSIPVLPAEAAFAAHPIDRTDRDAVVDAYVDELLAALTTPVTFATPPDVDTCTAGTESATSLAATMTAVNYYRSMAGLPTVTNHVPWNAKAQAAALISEANDKLTHTPDATWECYSAAGLQGASHSNLSLGTAAAQSVAGYMYDDGEDNYGVGHRRWILYPPSTRMGSGSTQNANALWVVDDAVGSRPDGGSTPWVAWPPAGYVPWEVIPHADRGTTLFRWSLSSNAHPQADYSDATVTMTYGAEDLVVTQEPLGNGDLGAGDNALVWNARRVKDRRFPIESAAKFTVTVGGIRDGGTTLPDHTYTVTAVRAVPDTTGPGPAEFDFEGIAGGLGRARMRWFLPWDEDLKGVELRVIEGEKTPSRTTGTRVCLKRAPLRTCIAKRLDQGVRYTFATFAYDFAGNYGLRRRFSIWGSTVTASAKPATADPGSRVAIRGRLWNGKPGGFVVPDERVHLQYRRRNANGTWSAWTADGSTVTTNGSDPGRYAFHRTVQQTTQFRVTFRGATFYVGSRSPSRTVKVS